MSNRRDRSKSSGDGKPRRFNHPHVRPGLKRQRLRLSCYECHRRKVSCDRGAPCQRCIKRGMSDRCAYESDSVQTSIASSDARRRLPPFDTNSSSTEESATDLSIYWQTHEAIRELELEVTELKIQLSQLSRAGLDGGCNRTIVSSVAPTSRLRNMSDEETRYGDDNCRRTTTMSTETGGLRFFPGQEFRTRYVGPYNAGMAFVELTGLCPLNEQSADEWLRPIWAHDGSKGDRSRRKDIDERSADDLESLLPTKTECEALINAYLEHFEQIHRIVHIPTFRKEFIEYWGPKSGGSSESFAALIIGMMAVSISVYGSKDNGRMPKALSSVDTWIKSCDRWLSRQSQKHRCLAHYQVACLLHLAKTVNSKKKKRFWTGSAALIQEGITDGLHRKASHLPGRGTTVFQTEMRRRIWVTIQEFNMQASFDDALPTFVHQLYDDSIPPRNIDDKDFDESTSELPASKSISRYTLSSFQHLSWHSLGIRLEISRVLHGPPSDLSYDQVIQYTNRLEQEINSLPSWDTAQGTLCEGHNPQIANALLQLQIKQYIIPLHQPFLRGRRRKSQHHYSVITVNNTAREIILLHEKLYSQGIRLLNFLREDALITALDLYNIAILQPRGSTSMTAINPQQILGLIENCIALKEDRLIRCGSNEPWEFSIMCVLPGLLEIHLGTKEPEIAKSLASERFINLHQRIHSNAKLRQVEEQIPCSSPTDPLPTSSQKEGILSNSPSTWFDPEEYYCGSYIREEGGDCACRFHSDPGLGLRGFSFSDIWDELWEYSKSFSR